MCKTIQIKHQTNRLVPGHRGTNPIIPTSKAKSSVAIGQKCSYDMSLVARRFGLDWPVAAMESLDSGARAHGHSPALFLWTLLLIKHMEAVSTERRVCWLPPSKAAGVHVFTQHDAALGDQSNHRISKQICQIFHIDLFFDRQASKSDIYSESTAYKIAIPTLGVNDAILSSASVRHDCCRNGLMVRMLRGTFRPHQGNAGGTSKVKHLKDVRRRKEKCASPNCCTRTNDPGRRWPNNRGPLQFCDVGIKIAPTADRLGMFRSRDHLDGGT
ncbi:hypothetical protein C7974DRAFT_448412 [Boeremia exigua]|uniref:uncharacterized protein n=1 Tax=Boeremia exigua TaxID=749465 RepID=UPI001E8CF270|nr:uncharacterized protein C7974DRAFT_448412 [Boeremia exigua]KAH6638742.1 hypothetical protein C7974DRAFT_448412 [Boeremia exigua]